MRSFILLFFFSLLSFGVDISKATEEHDKAIATADAKFVKYLVGVVKKAPDTEKVEIYKLIAKYDPKNADAQKFVAAITPGDGSDLLGGQLATIPQALAQKITRTYLGGSMTGKLWDTIPGEPYTVFGKTKTDTKIQYKKGESYLIAPNPDDKWQRDSDSPVMDYKSGIHNVLDAATLRLSWALMKETQLEIESVQTRYTLSSEKEGVIFIQSFHPNSAMIGSIRVKVLKVTP